MSNHHKFSATLLGCGAVVQDFYLPVLKQLSDHVHVRWCVDVVAENSKVVADALGAEAVSGGLEQMLSLPPTDGVVISLPNRLHAPAITACLAKGQHVFCEKPVTTTSAECDEIERALSKTDRTLTVNLLRRCFPASLAMAHVLKEGAIGPLLRIEVTEGGRGGWKSRSGFQFSRDNAGGGVTLDRGSHIFDLLVHWLGTPTLVSYVDDASGGTESTSITQLTWPDGPLAEVRISKYEPWTHAITVEGARGIARWTPAEPGYASLTFSGSGGEEFESVLRPRGSAADSTVADALATIIEQWVEACRGHRPNPTPFTEVRASIDLITRCYETRLPLELEWLVYQE